MQDAAIAAAAKSSPQTNLAPPTVTQLSLDTPTVPSSTASTADPTITPTTASSYADVVAGLSRPTTRSP